MTSIVSPYKWYVLYTRNQYELKVCRAMDNLGIDHLLPCYLTTRQWSDRKKELRVPMFPRYVFVQMPFILKNAVLGIKGVLKIVSRDGRPEVVQTSDIELIQRLMVDGGHVMTQPVDLQSHTKVRIKFGAFKGLEGEFATINRKSGVRLTLNCLDKNVWLQIPESFLEPF